MRTLQFKVNGQRLTKNGDFSNVIRGSKDYLQCSFDFEGDEWVNYKPVAVFECGNEEFAVRINSYTCKVPNEVTDSSYFKIRLVGVKGQNGVITTNKVLVSQEG